MPRHILFTAKKVQRKEGIDSTIVGLWLLQYENNQEFISAVDIGPFVRKMVTFIDQVTAD